MSHAIPDDLKTVKYFHAPGDNRIIAIFIGGDFDEYEKYPPFMDTEEEIAHVRDAYNISDPTSERRTKAHVTDNSWPLQVVMLNRDPGGTTNPHYHIPDQELPPHPTRHQILLCQKGSARIGIFTREGDNLGEVILKPNDLVLMLEGHEVEFLEKGTRLIEVKQGPFPGTDEADKIDLEVKQSA